MTIGIVDRWFMERRLARAQRILKTKGKKQTSATYKAFETTLAIHNIKDGYRLDRASPFGITLDSRFGCVGELVKFIGVTIKDGVEKSEVRLAAEAHNVPITKVYLSDYLVCVDGSPRVPSKVVHMLDKTITTLMNKIISLQEEKNSEWTWWLLVITPVLHELMALYEAFVKILRR